MAKPKKDPVEQFAEMQAIQPPTEREIAPEPEAVFVPPQPVYTPPLAPRQMRIERQNAEGVPVTRRFPQVRSGTCEYCGVMDPNVPAQYQYKLCPHYRGQSLWCSYCPENKNPEEVIAHSVLNVAESPDKPGQLIVWCNSLECTDMHLKRFRQTVR